MISLSIQTASGAVKSRRKTGRTELPKDCLVLAFGYLTVWECGDVVRHVSRLWRETIEKNVRLSARLVLMDYQLRSGPFCDTGGEFQSLVYLKIRDLYRDQFELLHQMMSNRIFPVAHNFWKLYNDHKRLSHSVSEIFIERRRHLAKATRLWTFLSWKPIPIIGVGLLSILFALQNLLFLDAVCYERQLKTDIPWIILIGICTTLTCTLGSLYFENQWLQSKLIRLVGHPETVSRCFEFGFDYEDHHRNRGRVILAQLILALAIIVPPLLHYSYQLTVPSIVILFILPILAANLQGFTTSFLYCWWVAASTIAALWTSSDGRTWFGVAFAVFSLSTAIQLGAEFNKYTKYTNNNDCLSSILSCVQWIGFIMFLITATILALLPSCASAFCTFIPLIIIISIFLITKLDI